MTSKTKIVAESKMSLKWVQSISIWGTKIESLRRLNQIWNQNVVQEEFRFILIYLLIFQI